MRNYTGSKESRIQIPLRLNPTVADVLTLRKRLLFNRAAPVACLAQAGSARGELDCRIAGALSLAFQQFDELPRRTLPHRLAVLPLEGAVRQLLQLETTAHAQDTIDQPAVQTLALGGEFAVEFGQLSLGPFLARRLAPGLRAGPYPVIGQVVVRVIGPPLPVYLALKSPDLLLFVFELGAELLQECVMFAHNGNGRGAEVQANISCGPPFLLLCSLVLFPLLPDLSPLFGRKGRSFAHQLGVEAIAPVQLAAHDADVLDAAVQAVGDNWVMAINDGFQFQLQPFNLPVPPPDAAGVALALDGVELVLALEARLAVFAESVLVHSTESAGGELLNRVDVQVFANPAVVELRGVGVQVILAEADGGAGAAEGPLACLSLRRTLGAFGELAGGPVRLRFAQQLQAFKAFAQASVVDLAGAVQADEQRPLLGGADLEG
jgi:hypothetical protein